MENEMNQAEFKKFPSLENTYRQKDIDMVETLGYHNEPYMVTEKVHGANFSFWLSEDLEGNVIIRCAKRSGWIEEDEKFFNYRPVLEKYKDKLIYMYSKLSSGHFNHKTVVVYGELYGGNVQSGMCYKDEQDFVAFDMVCDGIPRPKDTVFKLLDGFGIPTTPVIGIYSTLKEALDVEDSFTSLLCRDNFDGAEEHKEAEGLVIEPATPRWYPNGSRVYFKKKTKRFLEKGGNKIQKPKEELPPELENVLLESFTYITEPRFNTVCSKIGEVTIKDIGKVMGLMTQDILVDMQKDEVEIPENKKFMKLLQQQVQNFIRPILLNK